MTTATKPATKTYTSECSKCLGRMTGWVANCAHCGSGLLFIIPKAAAK